MSRAPKIDYTRYPYRGIQSEIARRLGVSKQAVSRGLAGGHPRYTGMAARLVTERKREMMRYGDAGSR